MLKKRRDSAFRVSAFKGCAALVAVSMFGSLALLFNPQSALAACSTSGVDPVTVSCAANTSTANTTNTTSPNAATSDRIQRFNADLIGQINSGVTVDTFGLNLVTTKANGGIAFTNSGAVTSNQNVNALQLDGNGGAVTYGGAGSITDTGGGDGLRLSNLGAGTITATVSGAVTTAAGDAISATGVDGLVTVNGQGAINAVGANGVRAISNGIGGVTVNTNAAATINANGFGVLAQSLGTAGNVTVTTAGVIGGGPVGGRGIEADIITATNAGTVTVTANANVSAIDVGIFEFSSGTGGVTFSGSGNVASTSSIGILAMQANNAVGTVAGIHVGGSGDTSGTGSFGISAQITGANNAGNVLVDRSGNVTGVVGILATTAGAGTVTVTAGGVTSTAGDGISASGVDGLVTVNGQGAINAVGGVGIRAQSTGTSGVTVTGSGNVTSASSNGILATQANNAAGTNAGIHVGGSGDTSGTGSFGISAQITGANNTGNILIDRTGNVTGLGGISATTVGGGNVTVSGAGNVNGAAGTGINATSSGGNGNVVVVPAGSVTAASGITASAAGTGAVTVTAGSVTSTAGDAISAAGVDGLVTVNGQGAINDGVRAISNGIGGVTVNTNAAATIHANGFGVLAQSHGTAGNVTVTTAGVIGGGPFDGRGIEADIITATNAGTVTVTANANVNTLDFGIFGFSAGTGEVTVSGSGNLSSISSAGILAMQVNNAVGTVAGIHVGGSGDTSGAGSYGISAQITGANNAGNVLVDRSGNVTGVVGILATTAGAGTVTVRAGGVTSTAGDGISASGVDGLVTVNGQGAISAAGGGADGIRAQSSGSGGITVTTTAAATIHATDAGILATSTGAAGSINVTTAGVIGGGTPVGGRGIEADITNVNSAGTVTVTANANVSATGVGIFATSAGTGAVTITGSGNVSSAGSNGILANQINNAAGANAGIHVGGSGDTIGTGVFGISAQITGANNSGNVLVDRTGNVTGVGGILATTVGAGSVTVTTVGNVNGGTGTGITAAAAGAGAVTVTAGSVTSTANTGITANGVNGLVTVNGQGAINAGGFGINAQSGGAGGITVTTTAAGTIAATSAGILAQSTGIGGNVTVTTAGVIGGGGPVGGRGIEADISNASSLGTVTITANANVSAFAIGIFGFSAGGILATQLNNAVGTVADVHVGGSGDTIGTGAFGISAQITGANNTGNILIDRTGNVTGVGGIFATTAGGGSVTVTGVGNVNGGIGTGIDAISSGGNGNVVVAPTGSVTGFVGIFASAAGTGASTVTVSNSVTGTGGTAIQLVGAGNTLALRSGYFITGNAIGAGSDTLQLGGAGSATFNSSDIGAGLQYQGFTTFIKNGTSTWTLTGSGNQAWSVQSGTLLVNGTSGAMTVGPAGVLGGNGIVGNTAINGGTLAPGNPTGNLFGPLAVQGTLAFTAASTYMVQISAANAGRTNVTGVATLGGATVNTVFVPGGNVVKQPYTILNATGGVSGIFNPAVSSNIANIHSTLSYDPNNVFLNVNLVFVGPNGLNGNQQNVANALTGFFNSTGSIPVTFAALGPGGLTQASGEAATGTQQTTFDAMNQFMGVLTDPFIAGRGDGLASSSGAPGFAEEDGSASAYAASGRKRPSRERDAYGLMTRAPLRNVYDPRWSVWAAGFGGSQTTDGNVALGSNNTTSRVFGMAAGADYVFSPRTIGGFALAGGGTNFSIANGLGSGRSDLFQAGAFVRHTVGPAYISAALAYGWQDITTDRTVTIAGVDQLRARFNANAFSGRVEGGYRFVTQGFGLTPYAAGQFTTFELPNYAETVVSGANIFALAYAAKSVTATRSELGLRSDKSFAMQDAILTLRGRAAWAHDFNPDRAISATFQTLPGASFVVNGAAQARDAALATASAEMKWLNGWSAAATFEGEFSGVTRSYAGKGAVRYAW
jgi:uncharacterized protein with beta-barrel porin domain